MDQAQRLRERVKEGELARNSRARVMAVTSGKGGVGKTNLSIALALAASRLGRNVVLLDADLGLANIDVILDIQAEYNLSHVISGEVTIEKALTQVPGGLRILPGAAGLSHMADLTAPEHQFFLESMDILERDSELLMVDTGAGIGRRTIDFCVASGEVLVVTTPEPTAIADAYAMIKVLGQSDPTIRIWIVINMVHNRNEADQILERIIMLSRRFLGMEIQPAGYVFADPKVAQAVRRRLPFSLAYPSTPATSCVEEISHTLGLTEAQEGGGDGFFRRMTSIIRDHIGASGGR